MDVVSIDLQRHKRGSDPDGRVDTILVGHNDLDVDRLMAERAAMSRVSGAYRFLRTELVQYRGRWMHYMDLINTLVEEHCGTNPRLHIMEVPSLALTYLSSFLTRRGLRAERVNFFNGDRERFEALLAENPRSVSISTTLYTDAAPVRGVVEFIRERAPDVPIIVGGPHISNVLGRGDDATQHYLLERMGADLYIQDSQGEATLARVLHRLRHASVDDLGEIPNLVRCRDGDLVRSPRVVESNDLDENMIDWSTLPLHDMGPVIRLRTARSCAFKCAFCRYPVEAGPLSLMSIDKIRGELRTLADAGVRYLEFIDDTFNVPLPRFKKLLRMMIEEDFGFEWYSYFRCANADDATFDLLERSGCRGVYLGIESGDQRILDNMNKAAKVERYHSGIANLTARGIVTYASFIIGFPGETDESVRNTIEFIETARPTYFKPEIYFHGDNVPIAARAEKFGLKGGAYSWSHDTMDWRRAAHWVETMYRTIRGSTVMPPYMFGFWCIPYLLSKGMSRQSFDLFVKTAAPLLLRNIDSEGPPSPDDPEERAVRALAPHLAAELGLLGAPRSAPIASGRR